MANCKECVWSKTAETYPYCEQYQDRDDCDRFMITRDKVAMKEEKAICDCCGRDKDPGKCWWCGQ